MPMAGRWHMHGLFQAVLRSYPPADASMNCFNSEKQFLSLGVNI